MAFYLFRFSSLPVEPFLNLFPDIHQVRRGVMACTILIQNNIYCLVCHPVLVGGLLFIESEAVVCLVEGAFIVGVSVVQAGLQSILDGVG